MCHAIRRHTSSLWLVGANELSKSKLSAAADPRDAGRKFIPITNTRPRTYVRSSALTRHSGCWVALCRAKRSIGKASAERQEVREKKSEIISDRQIRAR